MRLELSSLVKGDLDEIGDYIARDNPSRAVTFVNELILEIEHLVRNPFTCRIRKEIGPTARSLTYGRYVVLFRVLDDTVRVERVVHGSRRLRTLYSSAAK